jgi:hypothetical protein
MIQDMRDAIGTALEEAGLDKFYTYLPERPIAPCAILGSDNPFITLDGDYNPEFTVNWRLQVIAGHGTNQKKTENIDELIIDVLTAMWSIEDISDIEVSAPFEETINGAVAMSATLTFQFSSQGGLTNG